ncbi:MAG: hypothetical protein DMG54_33990 [Acidobacteria bacterium]|nr:MAG: hypothetical protein DMG54_33990 [Acidobacteriota bacterium]
MHSVFVAGSRALSKLNAQVKERLDNILRKESTVLVGDANGADEAVQRYLAERGYGHVVVYCMEVCRNNVGNWPIRSHSADPAVKRDRHYYGIKDRAMAKDASCGFMHKPHELCKVLKTVAATSSPSWPAWRPCAPRRLPGKLAGDRPHSLHIDHLVF